MAYASAHGRSLRGSAEQEFKWFVSMQIEGHRFWGIARELHFKLAPCSVQAGSERDMADARHRVAAYASVFARSASSLRAHAIYRVPIVVQVPCYALLVQRGVDILQWCD